MFLRPRSTPGCVGSTPALVQFQAERFKPPYAFRPGRPTITGPQEIYAQLGTQVCGWGSFLVVFCLLGGSKCKVRCMSCAFRLLALHVRAHERPVCGRCGLCTAVCVLVHCCGPGPVLLQAETLTHTVLNISAGRSTVSLSGIEECLLPQLAPRPVATHEQLKSSIRVQSITTCPFAFYNLSNLMFSLVPGPDPLHRPGGPWRPAVLELHHAPEQHVPAPCVPGDSSQQERGDHPAAAHS